MQASTCIKATFLFLLTIDRIGLRNEARILRVSSTGQNVSMTKVSAR